jgi:hypothetical protein
LQAVVGKRRSPRLRHCSIDLKVRPPIGQSACAAIRAIRANF